jgi:hypothetical protein
MRKSFCSRSAPDIHNGIFITDTQLKIGNIVKVLSTDPHKVTNFSSDLVITNPDQRTNTTFIDVISGYILGARDNIYFIRHGSSDFVIGTFLGKLSLNGNICIQNNRIIVIIYHSGDFIVTGNRPSNTGTLSGIVFTINVNTLNVDGFRIIELNSNFLLFGGVEESGREEFLYLLDGIHLARFNPACSPSWRKKIPDGIISAATVKNTIILMQEHLIHAIDSVTGSNLWSQSLNFTNKCCVGKNSSLYISSHQNTLIVTRGTVSNESLVNISETKVPVINDPILACISTEKKWRIYYFYRNRYPLFR